MNQKRSNKYGNAVLWLFCKLKETRLPVAFTTEQKLITTINSRSWHELQKRTYKATSTRLKQDDQTREKTHRFVINMSHCFTSQFALQNLENFDLGLYFEKFRQNERMSNKRENVTNEKKTNYTNISRIVSVPEDNYNFN